MTKIILFKHAQSGNERLGIFVREIAEHNSLVVNAPFDGPIVVHCSNVVAEYEDHKDFRNRRQR